MSSPDSKSAIRQRPADLPAIIDDWHRTLKSQPTINDQVEEVARKLVGNNEFRELINAVDDSDSVEGSLKADTLMAARMIRELARESATDHPLAEKNLVAISRSLNVVLKRYGFSRTERKLTVHGQKVAETDNGQD